MEKSKLQKEAERQVLAMQIELAQYTQTGVFDFRKASQSLNKQTRLNISNEKFSGDFALDEPLARVLASGVAASNHKVDWLHKYLYGDVFKPEAGLGQNIGDVVGGPGNIVGNLNSGREFAAAVMAQYKINSATAKIIAGQVQQVKINANMTLYNAEKSTRKPPILRVRIDKLPMEVISPLFEEGTEIRSVSKGYVRANGLNMKDPSKLAGMASKLSWLNSAKVGAVLTFAPTMALDIVRNTHRLNGNWHIDARQLVNDELKNQSGNAVGFFTSMGAGIILGAAGFAGAPIILVTLGAGIIAQFVWNALDAPAHMPQIESERGY